MFRRAVRFLLSPLVRWAAVGSPVRVFVMRDKDGAFLLLVDGFDAPTPVELNQHSARLLARSMIAATRDHDDHMPILTPTDYHVEVQYYTARSTQ